MKGPAVWLVKSGGVILGPYSKEEVAQLLRNREIVVLDEIARSCERWNYLRDEPVFARVVEELRVRRSRQYEDRTTTGVEGQTGSITEAVTEQIESEVHDELTEEIVPLKDRTAEIVYDTADLPDNRPKPPPAGFANRAYALAGDASVVKPAEQASRGLWVITLFVLLGAALFVGYLQFINRPIVQTKKVNSKERQALQAFLGGYYDQALYLLEVAERGGALSLEGQAHLGWLLVGLRGETGRARPLLENSLNEPRFVRRSRLSLGIADLIDGQVEQAEKQFRRVLEVDSADIEASLNLGVISMRRGDWQTARSRFETVLRRYQNSNVDGVLALWLTEVAARLEKQTGSAAVLDEIKKALAAISFEGGNYVQEGLLARLYLDTLLKVPLDLEARLTEILDRDPELTENYRHSLFVDRRQGDWRALRSWCSEILETGAALGSGRREAFRAHCHLKAGDWQAARVAMNDAVAQAPRDPIVQAEMGYLLMKTGLIEQARVAIRTAVESDSEERFVLPMIMMARYCESQENRECALRSWEKLHARFPNELAPIAGMAKINLGSGNLSQAKVLVERGLASSPNYKPLMEISSQITKNPNGP